MARNSRTNGLIKVKQKHIKKCLLHERWTKLAKECYKRGCNCVGCDLVPELESINECQMKYMVMGYIQLGYYPEKESNNEK